MDVKSKGLLRRMFDAAVTELSRRAAASEPRARVAYRPPSATPSGSAREPAFDRPLAVPAPLSEQPAAEAPPAPPSHPAPQVDEPPPHAPVVIVRSESGELRVRWNLAPEQIARSAALLAEPHVPCLRLISYAGERDGVQREVLDRPNVGPRGECDVRDVPARLIATFGLRAGERFVSVAHAVL